MLEVPHEQKDLPEEDKLLLDLENLEINKINRRFNQSMFPHTKNYYKRPTLPDVALEDRLFDKFNQGMYSGQCVFEWNIDGESEHNVLRKLQETSMVVIAYRYKGHTNRSIAYALVTGFSS